MKNNIISSQINVYRNNFLKHGNSPKGTFQNNYETQFLRYNRLLSPFNLKNQFSIHDIGCGICDLHKFLILNKIKHEYYGTDLVKEMLSISKYIYPEIHVYNRDILKMKNIKKCNIVVLSGTLNLPGEISRKRWKQFTFSVIKKMFELSTWGISFNFLTSYHTFTDPRLAYFDPKVLFDFCMKNLSRFTVLDHSYPLFESTITVFHEKYIKSNFPDKEFKKYFSHQ